MHIKQMQQDAHDLAVIKGWHESEVTPQSVMAKLMLIVSEVAEACEEVRALDFSADCTRYSASGKPEGFGIELADATIRIMDLCGLLNIDLEDCIRIKHAYNQTRPIRHGKTI